MGAQGHERSRRQVGILISEHFTEGRNKPNEELQSKRRRDALTLSLQAGIRYFGSQLLLRPRPRAPTRCQPCSFPLPQAIEDKKIQELRKPASDTSLTQAPTRCQPCGYTLPQAIEEEEIRSTAKALELRTADAAGNKPES